MSDLRSLRELRQAAGLTQTELSKRTGVARPNIAAIEAGTRIATPEMQAKLVRATKERPSIVLDRMRSAVCDAAARHHASNVRVFGSVLHGTDTWESDIDLLIHLSDGTGVYEVIALQEELETILGFDVDLVSDGATGRIADSVRDEAMAL